MKIPLKKLLFLALISLSASADIGFRETTYERYEGDESTITITDEGGGYLNVKGLAVWVNVNGLAHTGELDNTVKVKNGTAFYSAWGCKLTLKFENKELIISGDRGYCGGLGVGFNGHYEITNQENLIYSNDNGFAKQVK